MRGKNKCKILKEIRQKIADENDIPYITRECTYQGECSGTCPRCEAELRYLEQQLEKRQRMGKRVTVAALAASLMTGLVGCPEVSPEGNAPSIESTVQDTAECTIETIELAGDVAYESETAGIPEISEDYVELEGDVAYLDPTEFVSEETAGIIAESDSEEFSTVEAFTEEYNG